MNRQMGLKQKVTKLGSIFFVHRRLLISVEKLMNEWVNEGVNALLYPKL